MNSANKIVILDNQEVKITPSLLKRFWSKVDKSTNPDGCWNWKSGKSDRGYGRFGFAGKTRRAHRMAFALTFGSFCSKLSICHSCDNPSCVNPKHLWAGTTAQNMQDMVRKGRKPNTAPKGEKSPQAKLSPSDVLSIRKMYVPWKMSRGKIAKFYNVKRSTVQAVLERKSWAHI
jgi:hypothetical protein